MDRQPRYGVGDLLYVIEVGQERNGHMQHTVYIEKIYGAKYLEKLSRWMYYCDSGFYDENLINEFNASFCAFDTREQAYQAVCKLIDSDIGQQLDEIGKDEKG